MSAPQGAATVGYVAAPGPLLSTPHGLPLAEAEWAAWRQWMGLVPLVLWEEEEEEGGSVDFLVVCGYVDVGMDALSLRGSVSCVHRRIAAPVGDSGSGMCMAGFTGFSLCAVFLPSVVMPKMLDSWAVMNQKDSYQWPVHGWYC